MIQQQPEIGFYDADLHEEDADMSEHQFESSEEAGGMADAVAPGDWTIGKGKPPVEYQFPKGRSGNPGSVVIRDVGEADES